MIIRDRAVGGSIEARTDREPNATTSEMVFDVDDLCRVRVRVTVDENDEGRRFTWKVKSWSLSIEEPE